MEIGIGRLVGDLVDHRVGEAKREGHGERQARGAVARPGNGRVARAPGFYRIEKVCRGRVHGPHIRTFDRIRQCVCKFVTFVTVPRPSLFYVYGTQGTARRSEFMKKTLGFLIVSMVVASLSVAAQGASAIAPYRALSP